MKIAENGESVQGTLLFSLGLTGPSAQPATFTSTLRLGAFGLQFSKYVTLYTIKQLRVTSKCNGQCRHQLGLTTGKFRTETLKLTNLAKFVGWRRCRKGLKLQCNGMCINKFLMGFSWCVRRSQCHLILENLIFSNLFIPS